MKREFYIIICFLCFLVAAYAFQPQITHLASAAIQTVKQYIEEKRTPYVYEKGIQRQPEEKEAITGTNLDVLRAEEEKRQKEEKMNQYINTCIGNMTLEEKLAQMMILTSKSDMSKAKLKTYQPGGILFFSDDFEGKTIKQVKKRVKKLQSCVQIPLFVGVDEEGGTVSRVSSLKSKEVPVFSGARALYIEENKDAVREETKVKTELLKSMGINLNFNPVADVVSDENAYMYERSASGDAGKVAGYVECVIQVMNEYDMGSCLKHFPGYGNNVNTHLTYAKDGRKLSVYKKKDFLPFEAGIRQGADMVMVSHVVMKKVDKKNPASLSKKVHSILRNDLGFDGVVIADDLNMNAILNQMTLEKATRKAFVAGNDMIFSADFSASMKGAKQAVKKGKLSEQQINESVARILRMKINRKIIVVE